MSELSDYKRLVSDPHIADLKEIIARQAGALEEAERALEALKAKVAPLVELAEKATPGPWNVSRTRRYVKDGVGAPWVCEVDCANKKWEGNAAFIAAAHPAKIIETSTDIDAALTRIRAAKGGE